MSESAHEEKCPLAAIDRRLEDVHRFWHEAERGYFDPETFRVSIQTAIQTLRTVTFIVQSNKKLFPNFDVWYDSWQTKLRSDNLMRWMVEARNRIEKQGDLETHSFVRAEITASYFEEGPRIEVPAELFQSSSQLLNIITNNAERDHVFKDGILRIQRRWVENSLPDYELLDAVGIAYGKISELVADAHVQIGLNPPSIMVEDIDQTEGRESRGGRLPCMVGHGEARSTDIWLATGQPIEVRQKTIEFENAHAEQAAEKYGINRKQDFQLNGLSPEDTLNKIFSLGRKMISIDGYHHTIAFLMKGARIIKMTQLDLMEHGEKYLVMRKLAIETINTGADGVILIGETWSAVYDANNPYRRAVDAPDRKEFLSATLVTKTDAPWQLLALINRKGDEIILEETAVLRDQAQIAFSPIYAAWGREIPESWKIAKTINTRDAMQKDST
ncbi:hypothetical protein ACHFCA_21720 [Delftia tsuruhatensis]